MAFTQVTCTGTITLGNGGAAVGALIEAIPSSAMTNGGVTVSSPVTTITDRNGSFSFTLPANDDGGTAPSGTYYTIRVHAAGTGGGSDIYEQWPVVVSQAYAPTVNLLSIAHNTNPPLSSGGGTFQGPFATTFPYSTSALVTFNGTLYSANSAFVSGASFDATKWTAIGAQGILGNTEITSGFTTPSAGVAADVTGLSVTVVHTGRPALVEAYAPQFSYSGTPSGSSFALMQIFDVTAGNVEIVRAIIGGPTPASGGLANPTRPARRYQPVAGSRTYKVTLTGAAGLTAAITCGATFPAWIQVIEY